MDIVPCLLCKRVLTSLVTGVGDDDTGDAGDAGTGLGDGIWGRDIGA